MENVLLQHDDTYTQYLELAEIMCEPIDQTLSDVLQFELYESKHTYLRNLRAQCFRAINSEKVGQVGFAHEDLVKICRGIELTEASLKELVLKRFKSSLKIATEKCLSTQN